MKKRYTGGMAMILIAILLLAIAILKTGVFKKEDPYKYTSNSYVFKSVLPPIDLAVADTIPYNRYIHLRDSIRFRRAEINGEFATSLSSNFIGLADFNTDESGKTLHFIKLQWWGLDTLDNARRPKFFVKNDKAYLRKIKCDTGRYLAGEKIMQFNCSEYDEPIKYWYNSRENAIMVPVSEGQRMLITVLFYVFFMGLTASYFIYAILSFIKILISIARGVPFSAKNVSRLRIIAIVNFAPPLLFFFLNLLFPLMFRNYFTDDWQLSNNAYHIFDNYILFGIIALALHFAFKKGLKLKEEQEFTI